MEPGVRGDRRDWPAEECWDKSLPLTRTAAVGHKLQWDSVDVKLEGLSEDVVNYTGLSHKSES